MINYEQLFSCYQNDKVYSLQLEVGDVCHQRCVYCYMNAISKSKNTLGDDEIRTILDDAKKIGIKAVEWLGGEPLLRENVFELLEYADKLEFRNNVWTGGLPLKDEKTCRKLVKYADSGLISVHLSTINPRLYRKFHPDRSAEDLEIILKGIRRLIRLGYSPKQMLNSVTYTGMQPAEDMINTIDYFEDEFCIKTSLNVYHTYLRPETPTGKLEKFIPDRQSVARVTDRVGEQWGQNQAPMNCVNKQYCSATIAVLNDGSVTPCATIRKEDAPNIHENDLIDIFEENREELILKKFKTRDKLNDNCQDCFMEEECWGCRSRAYAANKGIYGRDPRCFRS